MKKLSVIFFMVLITITCCTKTDKAKYLFLNGAQLKQLGILVSDQGVFYKNRIPNVSALPTPSFPISPRGIPLQLK